MTDYERDLIRRVVEALESVAKSLHSGVEALESIAKSLHRLAEPKS